MRRALVARVDAAYAQAPQHELDFKLDLSLDQLGEVIGQGNVSHLSTLFGEPFGQIKVRRAAANGGARIDFHTDCNRRTMQVALNGDNEYNGGRLVYSNSDGLHEPCRPAGSATIHDNTIPHGVTPLVSGIRYGLFFLQSPGAVANWT